MPTLTAFLSYVAPLAGRYAPVMLIIMFMAAPLYAQTPPCSTASHAGAAYEVCASGQCERMVCNGTAYVPLSVWHHNGWEAVTIGHDTSACNASRQGRLRYKGGTSWEYCDGVNWVGW
jgi:hypothetical protein